MGSEAEFGNERNVSPTLCDISEESVEVFLNEFGARYIVVSRAGNSAFGRGDVEEFFAGYG